MINTAKIFTQMGLNPLYQQFIILMWVMLNHYYWGGVIL